MSFIVGSLLLAVVVVNVAAYAQLYQRLRPSEVACPHKPWRVAVLTAVLLGYPLAWSWVGEGTWSAAVSDQLYLLIGVALGSCAGPVRVLRWQRHHAGALQLRSLVQLRSPS